MSPRTVAALGVVFCLLLAGVLVLRGARGDGSSTARVELVPWPASAITKVSSTSHGETVAIERGSSGMMVVSDGLRWPADDRTASAGLRLLAAAIGEPAASPPDDPAIEATVSAGSEPIRLSLGEGSLSGRRVVDRDGETLRIESEIGELLRPGSLRGWASPSVLPGLDGSVTSIRIEADGSVVASERVGSRWGLVEPLRTPADSEQIAGLIGALATAEGEHAAAEADAPIYRLEVTSGDRTWRVDLDANGSGVATCTAGEETLRRHVRRFSAMTALEAIDAGSLIARSSVDLPPSDVARIEIASESGEVTATVQRVDRGWSSDGAAVEALLGLLTGRAAAGVEIDGPHAGAVVIKLIRFGDLPTGELRAWIDEGLLRVNDGAVTRSYAIEESPELSEWLSGFGG